MNEEQRKMAKIWNSQAAKSRQVTSHFLRTGEARVFTEREISEETEVSRGSLRCILERMESTGLIHRAGSRRREGKSGSPATLYAISDFAIFKQFAALALTGKELAAGADVQPASAPRKSPPPPPPPRGRKGVSARILSLVGELATTQMNPAQLAKKYSLAPSQVTGVILTLEALGIVEKDNGNPAKVVDQAKLDVLLDNVAWGVAEDKSEKVPIDPEVIRVIETDLRKMSPADVQAILDQLDYAIKPWTHSDRIHSRFAGNVQVASIHINIEGSFEASWCVTLDVNDVTFKMNGVIKRRTGQLIKQLVAEARQRVDEVLAQALQLLGQDCPYIIIGSEPVEVAKPAPTLGAEPVEMHIQGYPPQENDLSSDPATTDPDTTATEPPMNNDPVLVNIGHWRIVPLAVEDGYVPVAKAPAMKREMMLVQRKGEILWMNVGSDLKLYDVCELASDTPEKAVAEGVRFATTLPTPN